MKPIIFILCLSFCLTQALHSQNIFGVNNIHSHNDYAQKKPFHAAYQLKCGSIEADVFLKDGELIVAHQANEINPNNTLKKLYLNHLQANNYPLQLLIDLKTAAQPTLDTLIAQLKTYPQLIASDSKLTFVISGNMPKADDFKKYPSWIHFDGRFDQSYDEPALKSVALYSISWMAVSKWYGAGEISNDDESKIKNLIDKAHAQGKKIRFWATADKPTVWQKLVEWGVDWIGTDNPAQLSDFFETAQYPQLIENWHQKRISSLKSEQGWLNLAGLFWLKEGVNTFGSNPKNDIIFDKWAKTMGTMTLKNGVVTIEPNVTIQINGQKASNEVIFESKKEPKSMSYKSLRWFIIRRGDKYGVRLRDLESSNLVHFKGINRFLADPKMRIKAKLIAGEKGKTIAVPDVLGQINQYESPGTLVFELNGQTLQLDAALTGGELFIIFGDATNTSLTYGSGRFLYAPTADAEGTVWLDFNKAINPPCAFTDFATCPLPPPQNKLKISIEAGEKRFGEH